MFQSHNITGKFRPLQDWVILKPVREKQKGAIHLPDNMVTAEYGRCPVVAVGPRCQLKVGEVVFIQKFVEGEFKFELNGEMVYAIRERHINVTIEEPPQKPSGPRKGPATTAKTRAGRKR